MPTRWSPAVQGPAPAGRRSAPDDRRRHHRRLRDSGRNRLYFSARANIVLPIDRLNRAIAEARARGYLGANVLGSGFDARHPCACAAAGAISAASESALLTALEGRRAIPARQAALLRRSAACGASPLWSIMSRRCAMFRTLSSVVPIGFSASAAARWWYQALRRQRPGEAAGPVGASDRHAAQRNSRGACRRHARRL